jgi:CubicO group peptidase (beta-lactamase class C family)
MFMRSFHFPFIRHLFLGFLVAGTFILSKAQGFSPETQNKLLQVLKNFQNDPAHPFVGGMSAAIKVDGLALWQGATGYAARNVDAQNNLLPGGTSFTTSTLSRSYSVTKTFTAPLVLELAKEGKFSLNDPISKYLPLINVYNPALNGSVTVRQLLNHESGYSDWEEELQLQIAIAFDPSHEWTPYELMVFTHQLNAPGTVRRYSHNNFVFLGAIIEAATGMAVQDLFRQRFFEPLGLKSIYLEGREAHGNRSLLASPHDNISPFNPVFQFTGQPTFPDTYTNISAFPFTAITSLGFTGGGLVSNAADLAEWGNALFGGRITSAGIVDSLINSISTTPDEFGNRLGYGIKNTPNISGDFDFIGHNGSAPGYRSVMFYNQARKMSIVVLTNFAGASAYDIAAALYKALPNFICGNENKKENKIIVCNKDNTLCVDRKAAETFLAKGAYLGSCDQSSAAKLITQATKQLQPKDTMSISVFPNPSSTKTSISVQTELTGKSTIALYDMNGKLVSILYDGTLEKGKQQQIELQTSKLQAGMYFINLQTPAGKMQQKLIVSH